LKILITGSSGFIGSALIKELKKNPLLHLTGVSGSNGSGKLDGIDIIYADLSKTDFTDKLPETVDVVIHLAQSKHYREFPAQANNIFQVNVLSTQILLDWSTRAGVKRFIYASSGNVYKPQNKLLLENDLCEPLTYYGRSKYAAESIILPYQSFFEVLIFRIFGVYGPGQVNMTIPNIIRKVQNEEEITLAANTGLSFTPLYIDDCVQILKTVIGHDKPFKQPIYNLAGTERTELNELVQIIAEHINKKPHVKITGDEPMYLMADGSKLLNEIKITPKTTIKSGILKTLNYEKP